MRILGMFAITVTSMAALALVACSSADDPTGSTSEQQQVGAELGPPQQPEADPAEVTAQKDPTCDDCGLAAGTLVDCNAKGSTCKAPYTAKGTVGGFAGKWAWCQVAKNNPVNKVYRWGGTAGVSFGGWGGWTSTTDTVSKKPTAAQIATYRDDNAICVSWNSFADGAELTLSQGSEVACGIGAGVKATDCNKTKVCKNEKDYKGGKIQIAVTNFVGTSQKYAYNSPTGLDPCQ